ncbi:PEP-CTERM sorting domain-containing protein [Rheinheimera gaetbuli]
MKSLTKLISKSLLAITLIFSTSFAANAALIKQDIIGDIYGNIGYIEIAIDDSLLNTGSLLDSAYGEITLVSFRLFGLDVFDIFGFSAVVDSDNIFAGIEFFEFDGDDVGFGADTLRYYLIVEALLGFGTLEVTDINGDFVGFDTLSFGTAQVVSAPSTIALFVLAMGGLLMRRRRIL